MKSGYKKVLETDFSHLKGSGKKYAGANFLQEVWGVNTNILSHIIEHECIVIFRYVWETGH